MSEQYVRFISKKDEWFDAGTEVFDGSVNDYDKPIKRILLKDYSDNWEKIRYHFRLWLKKWTMGYGSMSNRRI